ncbi:hypothetical protein VIBNIWn13_100021 [Vibrio nigripulchritudo Wn13]|nr:hypothetical protein VIBNISFn118_640043 [Vibrio nigripulchritudo SFn118]CCO50424.1 hypothetical protein VIBNIWn13_100021 [Vibrio nigripulchritudo Wn13]
MGVFVVRKVAHAGAQQHQPINTLISLIVKLIFILHGQFPVHPS